MIFRGDKHLIVWLLMASCTGVAISCVYKPGTYRRNSPRRAFYMHQKVPDIDEFSQGASGKITKPIRRNSEAFHRLSKNYNPGIVFDERGNADTRLMTKRCMEKLGKLEKLVKQRWPNVNPGALVKLRVVAAWDEEANHRHDRRSLHYEGRAVDIITSDKDWSKLGVLARLAVEAGFDWVRYVDKKRVHASVRADRNDNRLKGMGCFRSNATVRLEGGQTTTLDQVRIGDKVESVNQDGQIIYSEVVMFLDNKPSKKDVPYFVLHTTQPRTSLHVTKSHLVYVRRRFSSLWRFEFAKSVQKGDFISVRNNGKLVAAEVTGISVSLQRGTIAPLTNEGNIVVDGALASCYALLEDHDLIDSIFTPAKSLYKYFPSLLNGNRAQQGIHWYARLLLFLNNYLSVLT